MADRTGVLDFRRCGWTLDRKYHHYQRESFSILQHIVSADSQKEAILCGCFRNGRPLLALLRRCVAPIVPNRVAPAPLPLKQQELPRLLLQPMRPFILPPEPSNPAVLPEKQVNIAGLLEVTYIGDGRRAYGNYAKMAPTGSRVEWLHPADIQAVGQRGFPNCLRSDFQSGGGQPEAPAVTPLSASLREPLGGVYGFARAPAETKKAGELDGSVATLPASFLTQPKNVATKLLQAACVFSPCETAEPDCD